MFNLGGVAVVDDGAVDQGVLLVVAEHDAAQPTLTSSAVTTATSHFIVNPYRVWRRQI